MEEPLIESEAEAVDWFVNLSLAERQEIIFKMKRELIARLKVVPDKLMLSMDGENLKVEGYAKGNQDKSE